jgi:hypothetical protein
MEDLIRRIIKEEVSNRRQEKLIHLIKSLGIDKASKAVGNIDNLFKVLNIETPMDFLHLFDDLDVVQSEEDPNLTLFRYKPKHNFIVYHGKNDFVYINYSEIWLFLKEHFGLNNTEIQKLTNMWFGEVYNLRGITTKLLAVVPSDRWVRTMI